MSKNQKIIKSGDKRDRTSHFFWRDRRIFIYPVWESTEDRLKRGDWQSILLHYNGTIRDNKTGQLLFEFEQAPSHEDALDYAYEVIDENDYYRWL